MRLGSEVYIGQSHSHVKLHTEIPSNWQLLRKWQIILGDYFFAAPGIVVML